MVAVYVQAGVTFPHHGLSYQMLSQRYLRPMCSQHTQADSPLALLADKHPSALPLEPDSDSRPTGGPTPLKVICHRAHLPIHAACGTLSTAGHIIFLPVFSQIINIFFLF